MASFHLSIRTRADEAAKLFNRGIRGTVLHSEREVWIVATGGVAYAVARLGSAWGRGL